MRMNNTCPECGAVYTVTSKDVGRRIACKKCRSALIVTERGLERDDVVAAEVDDGPEPRRVAPRSGPSFFERVRNVADVPTYLFGAGAFMVIYFLFAPLIEQAKVDRREGEVTEAELAKTKRLRATKSDADKKKIEEEWRKESDDLNDRVTQARIGAKQGAYWDRHGMMLGFLLLAFACLGYLSPQQPTIRRIVGAIVLCAMLLLIFSLFTLHQPQPGGEVVTL